METTNIHDFLHLLNLIKIGLDMDFGGGIWPLHIYATIHCFFLSKMVEKGSQAKTKVRGKKHTIASIHLFFSFSFFKLGLN